MNNDLEIRGTIRENQQVICRGECFNMFLRIHLDAMCVCTSCRNNKKKAIDSSIMYRLYG